jgi:hypothetical protein
MRKKGLSSVVATVALILLTFAAVATIAGYVVPLVRDGLTEGTECNSLGNYFLFEEEFDYNCFSGSDGDWLYAVSIGVGSSKKNNEIKALKLSFVNSQGESKVVDIEDGLRAGSEIGQIRRINTSLDLVIPKSGEVRTYVYRSDEKFESVGVSPVLESRRVCPVSDSTKIDRNICQGVLSAV